MSDVSTFRLYLLRAMYGFMFVGLAVFEWPGILNPPSGISNMGSVVGSVLGAISLLIVEHYAAVTMLAYAPSLA